MVDSDFLKQGMHCCCRNKIWIGDTNTNNYLVFSYYGEGIIYSLHPSIQVCIWFPLHHIRYYPLGMCFADTGTLKPETCLVEL